ncbi:hypothetical protein ACSIGC_09830 [Tenacibaculum sp. ZS6-P6]|uniref:hypothetical protein n=1 Tax=Tenacibaculum sp. ZS6-P6 TaxID=3447503 RepID=UPI003F95F0E4
MKNILKFPLFLALITNLFILTSCGSEEVIDPEPVDPPAAVTTYSARLLAAPLGDETSSTFMTFYNNSIHKISEASTTGSSWDFGYFYGTTRKASFASVKNYPTDVFNLTAIADADKKECFFAKSTVLTTADFDAISLESELNSIVKPTTQSVTELSVGDIIEFQDSYENKGLIKITRIVEGNGSNGQIEFDVKIQINNIPVQS